MAFDKAYLRGIGEKLAGIIEEYSREHYGYNGDMSKYTFFVKTMVKNDPDNSENKGEPFVYFDLIYVREALCDLCDKYDEGLYIFIKSFLDTINVISFGMDMTEYLDFKSCMDEPYKTIKDIAALYWLCLLDKQEGLSIESAERYKDEVLSDSSYKGTELYDTLSGELYNVDGYWEKAFFAQNDLGFASYMDEDALPVDVNYENLVFHCGVGIWESVIDKGIATLREICNQGRSIGV